MIWGVARELRVGDRIYSHGCAGSAIVAIERWMDSVSIDLADGQALVLSAESPVRLARGVTPA